MTCAWRPGSQYDVAATRGADNVLASDCRAQIGPWSSLNKDRMSHLCDSTVAGLERKCTGKQMRIPPFPLSLLLNRGGKKPINKNFTGLSRDYPGTVPGLSWPFPEISWEFCLCVSLFPQEKGKHINNLTPTHFRDNPAKLFMFIGFFSPD